MMIRNLVPAIAILAVASPARADDVEAAARAFSQAQAAMLANDPAGAADLYELADSLAPSAPALRNAARARLGAGHIAAAATWAIEILRRYPNDKESRDIADAILAKTATQLTAVEVRCTEPCRLVVDGKAFGGKARDQFSIFTPPGARTIAAQFGDARRAEKQITARLGTNVVITLEAPAHLAQAHAPTAPTPAHGLSRWWVISGGVVTLGLGAASAWAGRQVLATRDDIRAATAAGDPALATMRYQTGVDEQRRTNILLAATGAIGVGTIVCLVFTNWHGANHVEVAPVTQGATVGYRASF